MVIQWCTLYRDLHDHETGIWSNSIEIIWKKRGEKAGIACMYIFFKNSGEFSCRIVSNSNPYIVLIHSIGNFFTVH